MEKARGEVRTSKDGTLKYHGGRKKRNRTDGKHLNKHLKNKTISDAI
jgi:hypothetical protein